MPLRQPWLQLATLSAGLTSSAGAGVAAEAPGPVKIWYRGSEGCPDGQDFVARLQQLGRPAVLAGVGDRVDFVITLGARASSSVGRLERQTQRGTVAIRQVESSACADVAEALALSLELALEPVTESPAEPTVTPPTQPSADEPSSVREPAQLPAPAQLQRPTLQFGAQASVLTGVAPTLLPGGALFVELPVSTLPVDLRFTLHGAYERSRVDQLQLGVGLLGARFDACAGQLHAGNVSIAPCLGVNAGLLTGSSSGPRAHSAAGPWTAAGALLRAGFWFWPKLAPELQAAAVLPLVHYTYGAPDGDDLYRTRTLGVELSVGAHWAP